MERTRTTILLSWAVALAAVGLLTAASTVGNVPVTADSPSGPDVVYLCVETTDNDVSIGPYNLNNKASGAHSATLGEGSLFCELAGKNEDLPATPTPPATPAPSLRCFEILDGHDPDVAYVVKTQFHPARDAYVVPARELCLPATKAGDPPLDPVYECYQILPTIDPGAAPADIHSPNFGVLNVEVGIALRLCIQTDITDNAKGDNTAVSLVCYGIQADFTSQALTVNTGPLNGGTDEVTATRARTLCVNASQTAKPADDGSLSGISDVLIHLDDKNLQAVYCKTRTDHDDATNEVKTASACYSDTPGQTAPGSKVPTDPNIDLNGPPPPPPYGTLPFKGSGFWDPGTDTLVGTTCFESVPGTLGPNVISVVTVPNAKATLPNQSGITDIYFGQGIDECNSLIPAGDPTQTLPVNITTYDTPPYDNVTSVDSDGDGCPDALELDKVHAKTPCGIDPWNPHDSDLDFNGMFIGGVELIRADTCPGTAGPPPIGCDGAAAGDIVAGSYVNCQMVIDHDLGTGEITGKSFCYLDNPVTTVNIEDNGGAAVCAPFPSANPEDCGDGLPGPPPPGAFADNDGVGTPGVVSGFVDIGNSTAILETCVDHILNPILGPAIFFRVDATTGTGEIWLQLGGCSTKPTGPPTQEGVRVAAAEQDDDFDLDQDGCTAAEELGTNKFAGGQRDPFNKYDHMDKNKDGFINIPDDILPTAAMFGPSAKGVQGNVGPRMTGSVPWAHRNGDIAINIPDDILGVAAQFGHNCDGTPG